MPSVIAEDALTGIAAIIAALATLVTAVGIIVVGWFAYRTHTMTKAIDRAVNGQPPDVAPLVDNIKGMVAEQARVAEEKAGDDAQRTAIVDEQARVADEYAAAHQRADAVARDAEPGSAADAAVKPPHDD